MSSDNIITEIGESLDEYSRELAEAISLEIQRDSRRYRTELDMGGD